MTVVRAPLTLVVCGAPLAARADDVIEALGRRREVSVVISDAARGWLTESRHDPSAPEGRRREAAVVVAPLTFNTANKVAAGIMDTPACGVLCDGLVTDVDVLAVPMVAERLWRHPAWASTLRTLAACGVRFLDPATGRVGSPEPVRSGQGAAIAAAFDPAWIVDALGPDPAT